MRIVSRHLATDNVSIMFPIVDILMLLNVICATRIVDDILMFFNPMHVAVVLCDVYSEVGSARA